jgi:hypothetical protein
MAGTSQEQRQRVERVALVKPVVRGKDELPNRRSLKSDFQIRTCLEDGLKN